MPLSVLAIAEAKGVVKMPDGSITAQAFHDLDLPFFAGCQCCFASLGPSQSYPSRSGYIRCKECIGYNGFTSAQEFDKFMEEED